MKNKLTPTYFNFVILLLGFILVVVCQAKLISQKSDTITPVEAAKLLEEGKAVLVDVRELNEVSLGMAMPAQWMPLSHMNEKDPLFKDFLKTLPQEKLIIVYCASGMRAKKAQTKLSSHGFRAANMGAYSNWVKAGFPTTKQDSKPK